jgi:hypothetical protein
VSLRVERLRNTFITPRDHPRREEVCARMESSVAHSGADVLARMLDETLDPADPSVWVIRRLRLSFAIIEPKQAHELWARGIAEGLRRQIQIGPDGRNVLHFPDRATYWAWFLRDLAGGTSSHWWYQPLDSFRRLNFGAACLTLLSRQPELTASVLAHIDEWDGWREAAPLISEDQAERLLQWISEAVQLPAAEVLEAAIAAWVESSSIATSSRAARRLSAVVRLLQRRPAFAAAAIRGAVEIIAEAEAALHSMGEADWVRLVAAKWEGEGARLREERRAPTRVRMLLRLASREKVEQLFSAWKNTEGCKTSIAYTTLPTEFGGWFLLLPSYLSLEVDSLADEDQRPALRWLIARMCMGLRGRAADMNDPALLWSSGLENAPPAEAMPQPDLVRVAEWLAEIQVPHEDPDPEYFGGDPLEQSWATVAACVLRHFAGQLPGFAHSSPRHLDANLFDGRTSLHLVPGSAEVVFSRRPLDILLRMGGFDGKSYSIPWNEYATVTIRLD